MKAVVIACVGLIFAVGCSPSPTGDKGQTYDPEGLAGVTKTIDRPGKSHVPTRNAAGTATVEYFGGPVIPNAKVYVVWWGNPAALNPAITAAHGGIADFFAGITNSNFVDWFNEYNTTVPAQAGSHSGSPGTNQRIGRGNYAGTLTLSAIPSGNLTDAQIQTTLDQAFSAGTLPPPDENTIYAIYFPPSVTITLPDGSQSCSSFGAYHEATIETQRHDAYYLVMPDCGDSFSGTTLVTSHELAEATTDGIPTPGSNPDFPQAWNDSTGSEVGDLCQGSSGTVNTDFGTFTVQGIWDELSQGCKVTRANAQDFNVALSPNVATVVLGSAGTFTIQTTTVAGQAQALTLSVAAPPGVSATLASSNIASGQSTTLTVIATNPASSSGLQVTVRADATVGTTVQTHTAALLLQTSGNPLDGGTTDGGAADGGTTDGGSSDGGTPNDVVNGSFGSGDLTGWKTTGTASAVSPGRTDNFAARVGGTGPTNGDSTLSQTFTVSSANAALSFWYNNHCPDSVQYDWATATLTDNTAGTTTTLLAKVCSNLGWQQVTSNVTTGHSYTLTLISHDDNFAGDPTYTDFDDVSVNGGSKPPPGIINGGFETGDLTGWTAVGTTSVAAQSHTGAHAAQLGASTATNGDSSLSQTFTAPAGSSSLSIWYANKCPDAVQFDWARVTLTDNTANTTSTVLGSVCDPTGAWKQVTAPVTVGHTYTVTLVNHDDNFAGDPTLTLYDDVTLL